MMLEDGDKIPKPSSLEKILANPDHQDAIAFMVIEVSDNLISNRLELVR